MNRLFKTTLCSGVALAAMAASVPAISQEITSTIRGTVTTPAGNPAAGYTVVVSDTRTGSSRTTTTNANGVFAVRGLTVGGPFTVRVSGGQYEDFLLTEIYTDLGSGGQSFNITLSEADADLEEIVVTASSISVTNLAIGPSSAFNLQDIQNQPSISRQVRDIIRIDPRVNIGRSSGGEGSGINCGGASNRINSFTIDGVRAADPFGLNASGNLARSTFPIPFDTISAASVEFSPVDVEYGQFTGCNVNVVTKSGTNDFHGSAFFLYNSDSLSGSDIDGADQTGGAEFDRYNWGAELGGPIIEDKLFFYFSYEETDTSDIQEEGPLEAGFSDASNFSLDEVNRIRDILNNQYGRDPGEIVRTLPNTSVRYFGRLDWNINDNHRLEATYSRLEEDRLLGDDIGTGRGNFTFSDNFQQRGSISDTYAVRLFSNWTDNFSTEIRASRNDIGDVQSPVGGGEAQTDNPRPRIMVGLPFGNEFFGADFVSGPGTFRSANQLDTEIDQIKAKATYVTGDHEITFGYELDSLDVFNLFIINATGTIIFDSIDSLEAGTASNIRQGVPFSGNPSDAAAIFKRDIHTLYLQDEWQVTSNFNLVAGLRYDFYKSGDSPISNPSFNARYGFDNTQAFDGLDALQPRIGFTWELPESFGDTTLTGGFATFSGGDPTVWFANSFQNFGGALGVGDADNCSAEELNVLSGGSFSGIPQCVIAAGQTQAQEFGGAVAVTDPDFKLPTQNRFSLGLTHFTSGTGSDFFDDWQVKVDVIYSDIVNAVDFVDLSLTPVGTAPDGRPIFEQIDPSQPGCSATFNGIRNGFSNVTPECLRGFSPGDTFADLRPDNDFQDIVLTNAVNGGGHQLSIAAQFQKEFDVSDTGTLDFRAGYAYSDAVVGNAGTSSTAGSNFEEVTTANFNSVPLGTSQFNNQHNITIGMTYREQFFSDLDTSITAFFRARSGRPLSYVFDDRASNRVFGDSDSEARSLLYIPTGADDPLVNFGPDFDTAAFFSFVNANGLDQFAGEIIDRTTDEQPWTADIDLRFQQELPGFGFFDDDKFTLFIDFENFLNFIDSGAGKKRFIRSGDVGEGISLVEASASADANGNVAIYNFNEFTAPREVLDVDDTLWRINLGIRYSF